MSLDSVFKAYDVRGPVPEELNPELSYKIGKAYADYLTTDGHVFVGYDMRVDSSALAKQLIRGIREQGRDVIDLGLVTTDMVYFAIGKYKSAGGVMITGSHNAGNENGIKLYREGVQPIGLGSGLEVIRDSVRSEQYTKSSRTGELSQKDITDSWIEHALNFLDIPSIKHYKLAIDAGNGMAGKILPKLQEKLPFSITELYYELDGTFPNHEANPMKPENLKDLAEIIKEKKLDLGIAFDGDGDRAALVDEKGNAVSGSVLIGLIAGYVLKSNPNSPIVYDVRTTRGAVEWIKKHGGEPVRTKAGRVNIGPEMVKREAPFGGETTGHLFFQSNYYADSGLIGALMAIASLNDSGESLSAMVAKLQPNAIVPEINFTVTDKEGALKSLSAEFSDGVQDWLDGLTVNYSDWWFNIRSSNTEPVMRLNIEAKTDVLLNDKLEKIRSIITRH